MGGSRAVFASLGTSAVLLAATAIALLVVSAVVAFGGWQDDVAQSANRPALVFDGATPTNSAGAPAGGRNATTRRTLVIPAVRPRPQTEPKAGKAAVLDSSDVAIPGGEETTTPTVIAEPDLDPPVSPPPPPPATQPAPRTGDGVRDLGEDLSATVQNTGQALADATAPLAPPVSAAVQEVLNIVAALLRRGTGALGNTLDGVAAPR